MDNVNENSCFHGRIFFHSLTCLIDMRAENAETTYGAFLNDGTNDT